MNNDNDHDTLIKVETTQSLMVEQLNSIETKMDNFISCINRRVSWTAFYIIVGALMGLVGSIIGYNYTIDARQYDEIKSNTSSINYTKQKLEFMETHNNAVGKSRTK